jgi:hypothetical protein
MNNSHNEDNAPHNEEEPVIRINMESVLKEGHGTKHAPGDNDRCPLCIQWKQSFFGEAKTSVSENKKGKKFAPIVDEVAPFGAKELNKAVEFFRRVSEQGSFYIVIDTRQTDGHWVQKNPPTEYQWKQWGFGYTTMIRVDPDMTSHEPIKEKVWIPMETREPRV